MPDPTEQAFLEEISGFQDQEERSPAQLEEQGQIEDEIEAGAKPERPDPDAYDERDEAQEGSRGEPPRQVPVAELVAERRRRQELERELEALRTQAQKPPEQPKPEEPQAPEDPEPDYLDDPKGWTEWKIRQQAREIEALKATTQQTVTQTQQAEAERRFVSALQTDEQQFIGKTADYYDALNFARQRMAGDLRANAAALGVEVTDEQIQAEIRRQEITFAATVMQRGRSPAEAAYALAKAWGYQGARPNGQAGLQVPAPDRTLARGLPPGGERDDDLTAAETSGSVPLEFLEARAERFGRQR